MSPERLSFEQALQELERIVQRLEREDLPLEEAVALFERGQQLLEQCTRLLDEAELRVRQLVGDQLQPFEPPPAEEDDADTPLA